MNRSQRRAQKHQPGVLHHRSASMLTGLTLTSLLSSSIGFATPAFASGNLNSGVDIDSCNAFNSELVNIGNNGGTYNLTFTGTCVTTGSIGLTNPIGLTLNGPSTGDLTIDIGPTAYEFVSSVSPAITINSLDFTVSDHHTIGSIVAAANTSPTVNLNDVSIHDITSVNSGAIYAEGVLHVSDSSFFNLNSAYNGSAINLPAGYPEEVTISNSHFYDNGSIGSSGLGVIDAAGSGHIQITGSTFERNVTDINGNGAAINQRGVNTISISESTFSENHAGLAGGAISSISGTMSIYSSTFTSNSSQNSGGAISAESTNLEVFDSEFVSNSSVNTSGGAIYSEGSVVIGWSGFFSNTATNGVGGAVSTSNTPVDIDNSTFVGNSAADAGALLSEGGVVSNSTFWNNAAGANTGNPSAASVVVNGGTLFANILANSNSTPVLENSLTDAGANLFTDDSFVKSTNGAGASRKVSIAALKLQDLALNRTSPVNTGTAKTVALGSGSIARDFYSAGDSGLSPVYNGESRISASDQRDVGRPINGKYDVGAYEAVASTTPTPEPSPSPSPRPTAQATHKTILFTGNSAKLTSSSKAQLRVLAQTVQANKLHSIVLDGHTATLTKANPLGRKLRARISGARTRAVEKYLKSQFKKAGYSVTITRVIKGAANPVKSNRTEEGRKANRRVYITVQ